MPGDKEQGLEHEILAFKAYTCLCPSHVLCVKQSVMFSWNSTCYTLSVECPCSLTFSWHLRKSFQGT